MEAQTSEDSEVATATNGAPAPVAAVWHTLLLFAILGAWTWHGMGSANRMRALTDVNRLSFYAQTIAAEWLLLGFVLFGVWKYGAPLTTILGKKWQSAAEVAKDVGIALLFWICSLVLLGTVGVLLQTKQDRSAINFLLPSTTTERLLWLAVALTAGICEEAVFRGYLQRQLQAWTRNVPAGIFLSSIVFGTVHAYQGWRLMIIIWLLGAMLGILAFWRGTVRVGMISHAWQDGLAGLLGGFLKR